MSKPRNTRPDSALPPSEVKLPPSGQSVGCVSAVRGSVVEVHFESSLPPLRQLLRTGTDGQVAIEVLTQLDAHHVRGIALTPTQGLARGMAVTDTGGPLRAPARKAILSRMFDVFGHAIDHQAEPKDVSWRSVHREPPRVFADEAEVLRIVAEPPDGSFGLLPHRRDCVAALVPGILTFETASSGEVFMAVDEGVLTKTGDEVQVVVRRATRGTDLAQLREAVQRDYLTLDALQQRAHEAAVQLESGLVSRLARIHAE